MTKIEWVRNSDGSLGKTWNPIVGCSIVSPGCTNCYAMRMAHRLAAMGVPHYLWLTKVVNGNPIWTGKLALAPEHILLEPLKVRRPTMWFVNSMSDLFHESVPDEWIDRVFAVMAIRQDRHVFQVLTKRSARMRHYLTHVDEDGDAFTRIAAEAARMMEDGDNWHDVLRSGAWPLPNVWLGVSTERQKEADERIPDLLATPAAVRFVSAEPLLGPINFNTIDLPGGDNEIAPLGWKHLGRGDNTDPRLDWVIVGGESGPGARPFDLEWARSIVAQCKAADVACFVKQLGSHPVDSARPCALADRPLRLIGKSKKGGDPTEWPPELRVREMPAQTASPAMETA